MLVVPSELMMTSKKTFARGTEGKSKILYDLEKLAEAIIAGDVLPQPVADKFSAPVNAQCHEKC